MGIRDLSELIDEDEHAVGSRDDWMVAVHAIVVDNNDPELQHRIQVTIPDIDESAICTKWCRPLVWFTGPQGFGSYHLPGIGTEVVIFGAKGDEHHIYYAPVYNEDFLVPPAFAGDLTTWGFAVPINYKEIITALHTRLVGGAENITVAAARSVQVGGAQSHQVGGDWNVTVGGAIQITAGGELTLTGSVVNLNAAQVNVNAADGLFVNGVKVIAP